MAIMSVSRQLFHLQELDLEIESHEETLRQKTKLLGDKTVLEQAQGKLNAAQKHLDDLKHEQKSLDEEIEDISGKIKHAEDQLYGGKVGSPKELLNLQHEVNSLKQSRDPLETKDLEMMDKITAAEAGVVAGQAEYKKVETAWQTQQQQLAGEIDQLKSKLAGLNADRRSVLSGIDEQSIAVYDKLRKQKGGQAVAKVEQGICRACRISLSSSEMQQARGSNLKQCGNCGRILFLS
ncbi:MAG: hypothetical protein PHR56_03445 [Dehalococcoidales bacterium]|nr:hypothetical protein [Dehalococcoidales bacterium]